MKHTKLTEETSGKTTLSLEKFSISRLTNLETIRGGDNGDTVVPEIDPPIEGGGGNGGGNGNG